MGRATAFRLALALLFVTLAAPAQAAGRLLSGAGKYAWPLEVRLAQARSAQWSRLWVQYRLQGAGRLAIVAPAAPGTRVDPVPDAWFEALEAATSLRIVRPTGAPACGAASSGSLHVTGSLAHEPTLAPTEVALLSGIADVQGFAAGRSLTFSSDDQLALAQHPGPYVALVYELSGAGVLTQAVRFSAPGSAAPVALTLPSTAGGPVDLSVWWLGEGRARIVGAKEHTPDAVGFSWLAVQGVSDYPERRRELLESEQGAAWLVEVSGSSALHQWTVLPNQAGAIPPIVSEYLDRALTQGATTGSLGECLAAVWDARASGQAGGVVSERCPAGALALVPGGGTSCSNAAGPGEISASSLACGEADDLAHALAGSRPDRLRVTRHRGLLAAKTGDAAIELFDGAELSAAITAPETDLSGCSGVGGAGGSGSVSGHGAYGGSTGSPGTPDPDPGYGATSGEYEDDAHVDVSVSCWGTSEPGHGDDSCSGDSSSSQEGDGDACSGDSSDGYDDGGDSCSGDSSDGSDSCSGDSSDGYGDGGDSCSGDSGGGDSGCSSDSSSSGGDCSLSKRRPRRPKLSLLVLWVAALLFPLRRFGRRR